MENNYQLSRIHNYVNGLMNREEMHSLEREALDDPFLQEAIEGYAIQKGVDMRSLSLLQQRLEKRVAAHAQRKDIHYFSWQRLAIGLTAAVLFIAVCILLVLRYLPQQGQPNITEVELMDGALTTVSVKLLPHSDANPAVGWDAFSTYLSNHYSGQNKDRMLRLSFKVNEKGEVYDLQFENSNNLAIQEELIHLFREGSKWEGHVGHIEITFPE